MYRTLNFTSGISSTPNDIKIYTNTILKQFSVDWCNFYLKIPIWDDRKTLNTKLAFTRNYQLGSFGVTYALLMDNGSIVTE